jgi:hypothetical protein
MLSVVHEYPARVADRYLSLQGPAVRELPYGTLDNCAQ